MFNNNMIQKADAKSSVWESFALVVFGVYVSTQLALSHSTICMSISFLSVHQIPIIIWCFVIVSAVVLILTKPYKLMAWQALLVAALLIFSFVSAHCTGDYLLATNVIMLMAIAGIDFGRLCKTYCLVCMGTVALIMVLTIVGLLYNRDAMPNGRVVFPYGFTNPNVIGAYLFSAYCAMAYYLWNKRSWMAPVVLSTISAVFVYVSLSSYSSFIVLLLLAAAILMGHVGYIRNGLLNHRRFFAAVVAIIPVTLLFFMLFGAAMYGNDGAWTSIDRLIHSRIFFAHRYYVANGGFTLLGRPYTFVSSYHNMLPFQYLDCGFCQLAMIFGLMPTFLCICLFLSAIKCLSNDRQFICIGFVTLLNSAYLVMESHGIALYACSALMFLSAALAPPKRRGATAMARRKID